MPGLMAIIGANADPMRRELQAVERMSRDAGNAIQRNLQGNGGAHAKSGVITETLVLMRELSRGNFTRVPGSLTILLQRMGVLKLLMGGTADAANVLAQAWATQAEAAGLAATAAVRKAAASSAAFYADEAETEATLAQAVADEEGAAAAILNAKATQAKAIAASEAASATSSGAGVAVGSLGIIAAAVLAIAAGAYAAYKLTEGLVSKLSSLKPVDFHPEYIAKHLKAANQSAEAQKEINREVQKSIDLYNSAAKSAERVSEATKSHFEHLRKMNQYEKDPAKKAARELEIDKQERDAQLGNKIGEQSNLTIESARKKAEADAIRVTSKESDQNLLNEKKRAADEAQKYLDEVEAANNSGDGSTKKKLFRTYNKMSASPVSDDDLMAMERKNQAEAHQRIADYHGTVDTVAANDETRKRRDELDKQAGESASKAATLGLSIAGQAGINSQKDKDEAEEMAAKLAGETKSKHGSINSLQQIGAFAAMPTMETIAKSQLMHLKNIDNKIDKLGGGGGINHRGGKF